MLALLVCRPTSNSQLIALAEWRCLLESQPATSSSSSKPAVPSTDRLLKLVWQRAGSSLYFTNFAAIEMDGFSCHYSVRVSQLPGTLVLISVSDPEGCNAHDAERFLGEVYEKVVQAVADQTTGALGAGSLQKQLHDRLLEPMAMAETSRQKDVHAAKVTALQMQVAEVKEVMSTNVERILERGERLENIEGRTEDLVQASAEFKMSSRRVERAMCRKNAKWTVIVGACSAITVVVIIIIILASFGVFDKKH